VKDAVTHGHLELLNFPKLAHIARVPIGIRQELERQGRFHMIVANKVEGKKHIQDGSNTIIQNFSVISLFSGCGGLDLGFLGGFEALGKWYPHLPFKIIWANDINHAACETYRHNIANNILCEDINKIIDQIPNEPDVVIGGFPCQDISVNGLRKGVNGKRSGLYKSMVEVVSRCRPRLFIAENVKGLLLDYNKESFSKVIEDFSNLGYHVSHHLYLAADYGVPQMRERVFIVGTLPEVKSFREPQPIYNKESWISCKKAIEDLEKTNENKDINHIWSRAVRSPDQGMRILKGERPSDTIRAEHHGNIQFHYKLERRISMREAARLQSFPDNFIFSSNLREIERQVGNAVPPVLAWHIAKAVADCLID
jgi:DNA (cytosine-5)-methyltransferase 1